jgi:hypothetical protein
MKPTGYAAAPLIASKNVFKVIFGSANSTASVKTLNSLISDGSGAGDHASFKAKSLKKSALIP